MSRARRAKENKVSKKTITILAIIFILIVGSLIFSYSIETNIRTISTSRVESYNANDYIKDAFTETDGTKFLPIIYQNAYEQILKSDVEQKFREAKIDIKSISSEAIVTGTKIQTDNSTYTVLIYGDANSDGYVNVLDARRIVQHILYKGNNELTGVNRIAANVEKEKVDEINVLDAQRIVQFILGKHAIIDTIPAPDISKDNEPPVITLNGEQTIYLKVGDSYVEYGATVTDNLDPNVRLDIDSSKVDVNTPGKYEVTYKATDASGNVATAVRYVVVEDKGVPKITLKDDRAYIKVNVFDTNGYVEQGGTAIDEEDGEIELQIESNLDVNIPGTYTVTYKATNSKGKTATFTRTIEVINYVTAITLNGSLSKTTYNEGETIGLAGITATLTRAYGEPETITDLSKLGSDYEISVSPWKTATYNESNDSSNASVSVTVKLKYINPVDKKVVESSAKNVGNITVIGKIRKFIEDNADVKTSGEIYTLLQIAKLSTVQYQEKLNSSNLKCKITSTNESKGRVKAEFAEGKATISFYGTEAGTYTILITAGTARKEVTVTLTESKVVDKVIIGDIDTRGEKVLYDGVLKAGGKAKDVKLVFQHTYISVEDNETPIDKDIEVPYSRLSKTLEEANIEKAVFIGGTGEDGQPKELSVSDSDVPVTGIRIKVAENIPMSSDYIDRDLKVTVNNEGLGETVAQEKKTVSQQEKLRIYKKSEFSMLLEQESINLYLQKEENGDIVQEEDGVLYTLFPARLGDQYNTDRDYAKIQAENLSTNKDNIQGDSSKIVLIDGVYGNTSGDAYENNPFIKVAGFKANELGDGYTKCNNGDIDYIGIAINTAVPGSKSDEDERLEKYPTIRVYNNSLEEVGVINISKIIKKDISRLIISDIKTTDYCYENSEMVSIKSGPYEKDLKAGDLRLSVEKVEVTTNTDTPKVTEGTISEVGGEIKVRLNAPDAGTYKIKAQLGNVSAETNQIEITENPIVTSIAFKDKNGAISSTSTNPDGTLVNNFGIARVGKPASRKVVYYHDYKENTGGRKISREVKNPANSNIKIEHKNNQIKIGVYEFSGNLEVGDGSVWPLETVDTIKISVPEGTDTEKYTFDIIIDNSQIPGGEKVTEHVSVDIKDKAKIKDIQFVNAEQVEAEGAQEISNITLYKTKPVSGVTNIAENESQIYTVLGIKVIDEDGDVIPVEKKALSTDKNEIGKEGKVIFIDNVYDTAQVAPISKITVNLISKVDKNYSVNSNLESADNLIGISPTAGVDISSITVYCQGVDESRKT